MKVFISWSGNRSNLVANLLSDWLSYVLQACKPWVSNRDIDRGALWFSEISNQLKDTSIGIICLTQDNKEKPWILFEAGALANGSSTSKVCTFLIDLKSSDIEGPLAQFNHTNPTKEDMRSLVDTLNSSMEGNSLDAEKIDKAFETYWPEFEQKFLGILDPTHCQVINPKITVGKIPPASPAMGDIWIDTN